MRFTYCFLSCLRLLHLLFLSSSECLSVRNIPFLVFFSFNLFRYFYSFLRHFILSYFINILFRLLIYIYIFLMFAFHSFINIYPSLLLLPFIVNFFSFNQVLYLFINLFLSIDLHIFISSDSCFQSLIILNKSEKQMTYFSVSFEVSPM